MGSTFSHLFVLWNLWPKLTFTCHKRDPEPHDFVSFQYADAVEKYREVLGLVEEHKTEFRTDKLQQLHALHNLHEVLLLKPQGVGHTLRDSELQKEVDSNSESRDSFYRVYGLII